MQRRSAVTTLFALVAAGCGGGGTGDQQAFPAPTAGPAPGPVPAPAPVLAPAPTQTPAPTTAQMLQSFLRANYDQPNPHNQGVTPIAPAVTVAMTAPADLTAQYRYTSNGAAITYTGGQDKAYATTYRRFPVATLGTGGGNTDDGTQAIAWRVGASITASRVGVRVLGTGEPYRFIVDGRYVSTAGTLSLQGGATYITLDFSTSAQREIWVEGEQAAGFDGFLLAPGDTIEKVAAPKRIIFLGDSITDSTGAAISGDGYAFVAGDILGFKDSWGSGVASTGYVADASGTRLKLGSRLADVNSTGPWDIIVVAMGANDVRMPESQITAEATADLASIREANPAAELFVLGPFDSDAPSAPPPAYDVTVSAIQASYGSSGARFIDMRGVSFTKSDATHPDTAGHLLLGRYVARQIKERLAP